MLYLESPAGVGYSYSGDKNYTTNDDIVSIYAQKTSDYHIGRIIKQIFFVQVHSIGILIICVL
jgi:carboxypeptidase C (cathepsin A)